MGSNFRLSYWFCVGLTVLTTSSASST